MDDPKTPKPDQDTHFAPAARAGAKRLQREIDLVSHNPVIDNLLEAVSGLLAVLNEHRQILAVNQTLLNALGIKDPGSLLGLRPGEAVQCVYANKEPGGCGTSTFCSTCGAAISIVATLGTNQPAERECAITAQKNGKLVDLYFHVRCCPVVVEGERFLLLFLREASAEQDRSILERVFYHDVSNLVESLLSKSRLLMARPQGDVPEELATQIQDLTLRLATEVRIQKVLSRGPGQYDPEIRPVAPDQTVRDLARVFQTHPAAKGKILSTQPVPPDLRLSTDVYLLERVLTNMLLNAFEATDQSGEVTLSVEDEPESVVFSVWNQRSIPRDVARRIFQRNFTTKEGSGRGLGTYAMRLLGESYLHGKVDFVTSDAAGTLFRLRLPKNPPQGALPD